MTVEEYEIPGEEKTETEDQVVKKGSRVCGIAESFKKGTYPQSILAGVVQRLDGRIDGVNYATAEVGGVDATSAIKQLIKRLGRPDIQFFLLNGTVISYYNVIDLHELYASVDTPFIALTYEPSQGIEEYLLEMEKGQHRLKIHRKNGPRVKIILESGIELFIRPVGLTKDMAKRVLSHLMTHGKRPEPIRIAKLLAKAVFELVSQEVT